MQLSAEQKRFWNDNGFVVLKGLFSHEEVDKIATLHQRIWNEKPEDVVLDDLVSGARICASQIPPEKQQMRYKINDLYLIREEVRQAALHPKLAKALEEVLVDRPVLINSLNVDYGTQQPRHVDSLFMTPPAPFNLAASWIALEDIDEHSGPLYYYPGSHLIPPYKFSDGTNHFVGSEMDSWKAYMDEQVEKFGLKEEIYLPQRGDVLIWHSYLLHGGSLAADPARTRKSVIFHYFTESVCRMLNHDLVELGSAFWSRREPVKVVQTRETVAPKNDAVPAPPAANPAPPPAPKLEGPTKDNAAPAETGFFRSLAKRMRK